MENLKDVFLCHAGEDKNEYIIPLKDAMDNENITTWLDGVHIEWGDSITKKVNEGLRISKYVVVFFSKNFFNKNWPERELNSVLNQMASSGKKRILPIAVTKNLLNEVKDKYPLLNDVKFLFWENGLDKIIISLKTMLNKQTKEISENKSHEFKIQMPNIKKGFTQRDKDKFLYSSFEFIKTFFENGLKQLETNFTGIEADFISIHRLKFVCSIYNNGEIVNKCKIWTGSSFGPDAISYFEDRNLDVNNDISSNDSLSTEIINNKLGFSTSAGYFSQDKDILSKIEAAEYLWKKFTKILEE
ncbi:MAG TPA: toll/interleukin-1 receptor domain-containing protein [Candidatus Atribacteria bacterium]|nr:toll/interleukin-1 receptor domain-containing protein [Candidatus Atribacteria bacterium]